ncbi:endoribonuclease CG2145-like [Episyrphus balteatus]|uniref:endoribonuclease CG2145-like n=1 Tax=Episyrphus balteatus TaxID=286459 RepID=UPI002485952E|nr:endoribonuclease CG2145-like [Episyrphus balteatus]
MKFTLILAVSLVLTVWRFETADCRVPITADSGNLTSDIYFPRFPKNIPPYGFNLSYGPENSPPVEENKPYFPISPRAVQVDPTKVTDEEIIQLSESLYGKEISLLSQISVNLQGKTRSVDTNDVAPLPLLQVSDKVFNVPTIAKLRPLFDNYHMDTSVNEKFSAAQLQEQDDFLDAVMATNVMRQTMSFLQSKGIVSSNLRSQKDYLKTMWFGLYNRGQGAVGSSGFEHVFLGEISKGKIIGLHNWVFFGEQEKTGRLDYKGYINYLKLGTKEEIDEVRFTLDGLNKPVNTLFVGTSPEMEIALYTICFQFRPDELCKLSMGEKNFAIQTYTWRYNGQLLIGSAFPKLRY